MDQDIDPQVEQLYDYLEGELPASVESLCAYAGYRAALAPPPAFRPALLTTVDGTPPDAPPSEVCERETVRPGTRRG